MNEQQTEEAGAPTEEEVREYLQRLRTVPVEQLLPDVVFTVLNAAQAKLGRRDGRLLIDVAATIVEQIRNHVPAEFAGQADQILRQLQLGQVQAESQLAGRSEPEPNDLAAAPQPPAASQRSAERQATAPAEPPPAEPPPAEPPPARPAAPTSRLLIPGRDF